MLTRTKTMIDNTTESSVSKENLNAARELGRKYSKMNRGELFLSDEFKFSLYPKLKKLAGIGDGSGWAEDRNFGEVANAFEEGLDGY